MDIAIESFDEVEIKHGRRRRSEQRVVTCHSNLIYNFGNYSLIMWNQIMVS